MLLFLVLVFVIRACFVFALAFRISLDLFSKESQRNYLARKSYAPMLDLLMVFAMIIPVINGILTNGESEVLYYVPILIGILSIPWILIGLIYYLASRSNRRSL
jgi:hypothetical protein